MIFVTIHDTGIFGKYRKGENKMAKQKIVILGASGMLGSMLLDVCAKHSEFAVTGTTRSEELLQSLKKTYHKVRFYQFDAEQDDPKTILNETKPAWILNAIGVIKPYIHENNGEEIRRAISVNAQFPYLLAERAAKIHSKVIQIATDCVYAGKAGHYQESDIHDSLDVYGKSKSLGEVYADNFCNLRCSIIGPELKAHTSLMDWLLSQPADEAVSGFSNHQWNGITTLHFARICMGIIEKNVNLPHLQHIVPANTVSKALLLKTIAQNYQRTDISVRDTKAPVKIDRTLVTNNQKLNGELWKWAGYKTAPTIEKMIEELAQYRICL